MRDLDDKGLSLPFCISSSGGKKEEIALYRKLRVQRFQISVAMFLKYAPQDGSWVMLLTSFSPVLGPQPVSCHLWTLPFPAGSMLFQFPDI